MEAPFILISIAVLVVLLLILFFAINKKEKRPVDYYNLFMIGVIWTAIGLPMQNYSLGIMGLIFMAIGGANKDKWKKNKKRWKDLDSHQKKASIAISIILGILVLVGLLAFYMGSLA